MYFGAGCFWHVQHEMVLHEALMLQRRGDELSAVCGCMRPPLPKSGVFVRAHLHTHASCLVWMRASAAHHIARALLCVHAPDDGTCAFDYLHWACIH